MAQAQIAAKKTKSEILAEYNTLLGQYDELKATSRFVHQPQSAEAIAKAKANTADSIAKSISELKMTVTSGLNQLSSTASDHLTALLNEIFRALATFDELQQAIEISRKQLEVQYKIQVGAEILEQVVNEYEAKKRQLEIDFIEQKTALETEMVIKRRDYERETEEYNYTTKLSRSREQILFEEEKQNKIEQLAARELEIKNQETELLSLRQQAQEFPERLSRELVKKAQEVRMEDEKEWKSRLEATKKEWEAEKHLLEMNIATLEEQFKRHDAENIRLKQEAEIAHKKAQELAVKVIESGTRMRVSSDEQAAEQR